MLNILFKGRDKTTDMTVGNPTKLLISFFIPLLAGNIFQQLYSLVDSIVVGRGLGGDALAAVGATGSLSFLIIGFAQGLCSGFGINMAVEFGAKNIPQLKKVIANSYILCFVISISFSIISLLSMRNLLIVMKTDPEVLEQSIEYIRIIFSGIIVTITYNICSALLRSVGDSRTPFIAVIMASIINTILDILLVIVFDFGVSGAAFATIFAQLISCIFCFRAILKIEIIQIQLKDIKLDLKLSWDLIRLGIPVAIMSSITAIGCVIVQTFVNSFGKLYMSAFAAIAKIINLSMQPGGTIGTAISTFVSQNYGAKKINRIREGVKSASIISVCIYLFISSALFFLPKQIIGIIITEPEIIELTPTYLKMCSIFMFVVGELFVFRSSCMAMKRTIVPMWSGALELLLRMITLFLLSGILGFTAVPVAECAAWTGAMLLNFTDYKIGIKKAVKELGAGSL